MAVGVQSGSKSKVTGLKHGEVVHGGVAKMNDVSPCGPDVRVGDCTPYTGMSSDNSL